MEVYTAIQRDACPDHPPSLFLRLCLVVRAPDSGPEGLGSMPVPPNTIRVHTDYVLVKSVSLKVLWAEPRVQGTGENFLPRQFHASIVEVDINDGAIYRNNLSSLRQFHRAKSYCHLHGVQG
ncbi:uncharacterized protein TNCV_1760201 [Trichonephila clavipes]|nr:uncharacterized protein TNCV_1760201 [Trichonephila clavipes]